MIRRRPDIIAAERDAGRASNARIGAAMAEYYPKFSLSGLLGTATMGVGGLFGGDSMQASGILGLRWRLFDFGRVDAEIAAAEGRNAEALSAYRLTVLRASEDVENSLSSLVKQHTRGDLLAGGGKGTEPRRGNRSLRATGRDVTNRSTCSTPTEVFLRCAMRNQCAQRPRARRLLPFGRLAAGGNRRR